MNAKLEREFWHWMNDNWTIAGGLIQQAIAARLMGKTKSRINQMINEGKIKAYKFKTTTFVSYADVMRQTREEAFADLETATGLLFGETGKQLAQIIRQQKNMVTASKEKKKTRNKTGLN